MVATDLPGGLSYSMRLPHEKCPDTGTTCLPNSALSPQFPPRKPRVPGPGHRRSGPLPHTVAGGLSRIVLGGSLPCPSVPRTGREVVCLEPTQDVFLITTVPAARGHAGLCSASAAHADGFGTRQKLVYLVSLDR